MKLGRSLLLWSLLLAVLAPASAAAAETRTYLDTDGFGPALGAGTFGPASHYPAAIEVSGVAGTVTDVNLTAIELNADADLDMALVGPNGAQVMLMSDACSKKSAAREIWTFDDEASTAVPQSCTFGERRSFRPTDYEPGADDFALFGGPEGPFTTSLSAFDGISPNGAWELFMIDDDEEGVGFEISAFALELEVEPPPPTVRTVTVPGPTVTVTAPAPAPAPAATAPKTGKRAAALAKCKSKATAKARARCRARAKRLPV